MVEVLLTKGSSLLFLDDSFILTALTEHGRVADNVGTAAQTDLGRSV